jgi:hypothetical protein
MDVYAHKKLNMGALELNQQISSNVYETSDEGNLNLMDADVANLWESLLISVYSGLAPDLKPPKVNNWHASMCRMMKIAEGGNVLMPFARHVAANQGLVYPVTPELGYIQGLPTPNGGTMDFEELFQKAFNNTVELWGWLALSLQNKESPLDSLTSLNLDNGQDEHGNTIYWS